MSARIFIPMDAAALSVGADDVARAVEAEIAAQQSDATIVRTGSRGLFWLEPLVEVETNSGRIGFGPATAAEAAAIVAGDTRHSACLGPVEEIPYLKTQQRLTFARCGVIDPLSLADYEAHGGLKGLRRALGMSPAEIVSEVTESGLRGRGGAGFPTGIKWRTVLETESAQKYIVCNADEGDSGTFADRMLMEGDPFLLIEGMVIAGLAVGANRGFIYLRSEYPHAGLQLGRAIDAAYRGGLLGGDILDSRHAFDLELRLGAGAYICGEETSLLDSLEGKRGQVRAKPPVPAISGLFARPTALNNVLSFAAVPTILAEGAAYYRDFGTGRSRGTMPIQLGGNVKQGGLIERAFGLTLGEIIEEYGAGTPVGPRGARGAGGRTPGRVLAYPAFRYPLRLRILPREGRDDRPRGCGSIRRFGGSGPAGAVRAGILRHRILWQVHALPDRLDARRGNDGQDFARRERRRTDRSGSRPLRSAPRRVALRAGGAHADAGAQRPRSFSGRFREKRPARGGIKPRIGHGSHDEAF